MAALDYSVFGRVDDANNKPLSGGKLRIYDADTTSLSSVYSNVGLSTPLANPVEADSAGRLPPIFIAAGTYDLALLSSADVLVDSFDDYVVPDLTGLDDITFPVSAKTADYTLADGDSGKVFEVNADAAPGTLVTITAEAGDRGNGFIAGVLNVGTSGIVTITPDAGETIDGLSSLTLRAGEGVLIDSRGASGWRVVSRKAPGLTLPQGRLTLASATPVMAADLTTQTTIYYALYLGRYVPIWDGFEWRTTPFSELSLALDSNSGHTNYHQSGKNFDLFVVNDGGTIRLGTGPAWSSDTGRGTGAGTTELARTNGLLVNANSMTLRFGSSSGNTVTIAAAQATYVGSARMSANGQTQWVANPAAAAGGGDCQLLLWNMYNRVQAAACSMDSTNSWNYTTATWRVANAAGTGSGLLNRITILKGLNEDAVNVSYAAQASNSNGTVAIHFASGIGLDSTTAFASGSVPGTANSFNNAFITALALYRGLAGLGLHYFQALEYSVANSTTTWYGDNNAPTVTQMALQLSTSM